MAERPPGHTASPAVKDLVRAICFQPTTAPVPIEAFITSFPRYLSPDSLFRLLCREARSQADKPAGCLRLFLSWVRLRARSDFRRGSNRLRRLLDFITELSTRKDLVALVPRINELKLALLRGLRPQIRFKVNITPTTEPASAPALFSYPPAAIAEQLTHVDHGFFSAVPLEDFLEKRWTNKERRSKLRDLIERSNRMSDWVATYILVQTTNAGQTKAAERFLEVAEWCLANGNFYAVSGIISGFSQWAISRLTRMWRIKGTHKVLHTHCTSALSEDKNFASYRAQLNERMREHKACVPHVAVFLRDLIFIEDGNADFVDGVPNAKKIQMIGTIVEQIYHLQQLPYEAPKLPDGTDPIAALMLNRRLARLPSRTIDWIEQRSRELRPMISAADSSDNVAAKGTPREPSRTDTPDNSNNSSTDDGIAIEDFEVSDTSSTSTSAEQSSKQTEQSSKQGDSYVRRNESDQTLRRRAEAEHPSPDSVRRADTLKRREQDLSRLRQAQP